MPSLPITSPAVLLERTESVPAARSTNIVVIISLLISPTFIVTTALASKPPPTAVPVAPDTFIPVAVVSNFLLPL